MPLVRPPAIPRAVIEYHEQCAIIDSEGFTSEIAISWENKEWFHKNIWIFNYLTKNL